MTTLIERMRQELVRRNYAATTIQSYIKAVEHFEQHIATPTHKNGAALNDNPIAENRLLVPRD